MLEDAAIRPRLVGKKIQIRLPSVDWWFDTVSFLIAADRLIILEHASHQAQFVYLQVSISVPAGEIRSISTLASVAAANYLLANLNIHVFLQTRHENKMPN